jgi:glycosyltransferase involved in cell wall biosynthesis
MSRSLIIAGNFKPYCGYGQHVREVRRALSDLGVTVKLADLPGGNHRERFKASDLPISSGVILHICGPRSVRVVEGMLNVNYTTFETTRIPQSWIKHSLSHDLVILTCDSAKKAWMAGGIPEERLKVCPLGVDPQRFHLGVEPLDMGSLRRRRVLEYRTRFLNVSAFISAPRKNLLGMLRVWIKATNATDDAILILKLGGYNYKWWWPDEFKRALNAIEREIGKRRREAAPILFYNPILLNSQMASLYAAATHYWSMSHGEGWDLPMMEAGAMNLHLIAPNHSAYTTYLDESVAQMIPSRTIPANFDGSKGLRTLFDGSDWWEPDEETAVELIREAIRTASEGLPTAKERIVNNFTWQHSARRLVEILEELHKRHGNKFKKVDAVVKAACRSTSTVAKREH